MPLKGVLTGESLPTRLAEERFVSGMRVPVPLQVVLAIERQSTHVASERAWWGSRILHGSVDRRLWRVLCWGVAVRHRSGLRSVGLGGVVVVAVVVVVVVQVRVGHDGWHRLTRGV